MTELVFLLKLCTDLVIPYVTSRHKDASLKEGLGLGFFISKTLFERLGIKMEIYNKNKPESGAVVSILIPKQGWV